MSSPYGLMRRVDASDILMVHTRVFVRVNLVSLTQ